MFPAVSTYMLTSVDIFMGEQTCVNNLHPSTFKSTPDSYFQSQITADLVPLTISYGDGACLICEMYCQYELIVTYTWVTDRPVSRVYDRAVEEDVAAQLTSGVRFRLGKLRLRWLRRKEKARVTLEQIRL